MGNRAYVIFHEPQSGKLSPAVYLHWNGGPESVYAFLAEQKRRKCLTEDVEYTAARFCHVVADFFDQEEVTSGSLGIEAPPASAELADLQPFVASNNGLYLVSKKGAGLNVRRFVRRYARGVNGQLLDEQPLPTELTPDEVAVEKEEAMAHAYNQPNSDAEHETIAACFLRLRPKVAAH